MKNLKIQMLTVIATIVFFSCTKTQTNTQSLLNSPLVTAQDKKTRNVVYETTYGLLRFENRDALDNVCAEIGNQSATQWNTWEDNLTFSSLRRKLIETPNYSNKNSTFDDDLLKTLLNENSMFQVGDIIYKVSYDEGLVWSLNSNCTVGDYQNLINENWDASKMNRFYINDDVDIYDKAETGVVGYDRKYRGWFGSDVKANDDLQTTLITFDPNTNAQITTLVVFRADCKTSYQNAGIYKSVMAEMKYMKQVGNNITWNQVTTSITMNASWDFTPRKKSAIVNSTYSNTLTDNKNTIRPYSGTRICDGKITASWTYTSQGPNGGTRTFPLQINTF
jgi:hypothetical protein